MKQAHIATVLSFSLLLAAPAFAQNKPAAVAPGKKVDMAAQMFNAWDTNHDGKLALDEFRAGWERGQMALRTEQALHKQFVVLDANHDGGIDATEYNNLVLIKNAGKNAPPFARFDANANGKLEFAEYVKLVGALAPQHQAGKGEK